MTGRPVPAWRAARIVARPGALSTALRGDAVAEDPMVSLLGHSITYRIAVGAQAGRKVPTLQALPARETEDPVADGAGKASGVSLHAGVAAKAGERQMLEVL